MHGNAGFRSFRHPEMKHGNTLSANTRWIPDTVRLSIFCQRLEITLDTYETREQTAYREVILTWDGTVRRKKTVRVTDDMRQRIHDFPLYTVREFIRNARTQILCKQTGKSAMVDIPNGFPAFAQIGDLLICSTVEDDLCGVPSDGSAGHSAPHRG